MLIVPWKSLRPTKSSSRTTSWPFFMRCQRRLHIMVFWRFCRLDGTAASVSVIIEGIECLGHALVDMIREGLIEEVLVDSFNVPIFIPMASEVTEVITEIKDLCIEAVEEIQYTAQDINMCCLHFRAILDDVLTQHLQQPVCSFRDSCQSQSQSQSLASFQDRHLLPILRNLRICFYCLRK